MGLVYGKSINKPAVRERDEVLIARRAYLRAKLANRDLHGGTKQSFKKRYKKCYSPI
jgi:hypothetical protein